MGYGYGYGYYSWWDPTYMLVIIGAVLCMIASARVKSTYNKYSRYRSMSMDPDGSLIARIDAAQRAYDLRQAAYEASTAPDARLTTRPQPMLSDWTAESAEGGCLELGQLWQEGRAGAVNLEEAVRWYEYLLAEYPENPQARRLLAEIYRSGRLGYCDVNRAIVLLCGAGEIGEVAAMFEQGVNGPDGRVSLAPNAIIAEAFRIWETTPGDPDAGKRLGDLFRDGSIVAANADVAAAFYWQAGSQYGIDQLTALLTAHQVTDEKLLYDMMLRVTAVKADVSALIPAIAEGVLSGNIAPDGVLWQADVQRMTRQMLQNAVDSGKADAAQAMALLGRLGAMK